MGSKHGFPVSRKIDMLIRSGNSFSYEKKVLQKVASSLCNINRTIAWLTDIFQTSRYVKVVNYFEIHVVLCILFTIGIVNINYKVLIRYIQNRTFFKKMIYL